MTTASNKQTGPMGSGERAAVVGRAYAAFNAADIDTLTQVFDENSSWHTPGRGSIAGDRKGRERSLPSSAGTEARRQVLSRPFAALASGR